MTESMACDRCNGSGVLVNPGTKRERGAVWGPAKSKEKAEYRRDLLVGTNGNVEYCPDCNGDGMLAHP